MPRKENVREKILEAAEELVVERGVDALTMDSVAMVAGLGKGGVLHHFRYKVDLIEGLIERHLQRSEIYIAEHITPEEDIYRWMHRCIDYVLGSEGELGRTGLAIFAAASQFPRLMHPVREFFDVRHREIISRANDPELAAIILLATDGYGVFSGLGVEPITKEEVEGVRGRMHAMVDAIKNLAREMV